MLYTNLYRGKVRKIEFEDDEEVYEFYVRKPKAVDMIRRGDEQTTKKKSGETINRETIANVVVNEDGSSITKEQIDSIMELESSAFGILTDHLLKIIQTKKKDDEEKND